MLEDGLLVLFKGMMTLEEELFYLCSSEVRQWVVSDIVTVHDSMCKLFLWGRMSPEIELIRSRPMVSSKRTTLDLQAYVHVVRWPCCWEDPHEIDKGCKASWCFRCPRHALTPSSCSKVRGHAPGHPRRMYPQYESTWAQIPSCWYSGLIIMEKRY